MKYLLTNLLLIFFYINCYGQYQPMISTNTKWFEFFEVFAGDAHNYTYTCLEDTALNNVVYKKIENSIDRGSKRLYLLREDTSSKKVYVVNPSSPTQDETLLYDYNLQIGDTFTCISCYPTIIILDSIRTSIDSSNEENQISLTLEHPKFYYFHNTEESSFPRPVVWIESIGSLSGLLEPTHQWNGNFGGSTLICHFDSLNNHDFEFTHLTKGATDCKIHSGLNTINNQSSLFQLSPNPFSTHFNIDFNGTNVFDVVIQNELGEIILEKRGCKSQVSINLELYNNGIYFITLSNNTKNILEHIKMLKSTNY